MKVYKDGIYKRATKQNLQSLLELGYKLVQEEKKETKKKGEGK